MKYLKFFEGYKEDILSEFSEITARHNTEIADLKNKIIDEFKHYLYDISDNYEMKLDLYDIGVSNDYNIEELQVSFTVISKSNFDDFMGLMDDLEIASNRIEDDKDMKIYLNSVQVLTNRSVGDYVSASLVSDAMLPVSVKGMKNIYDRIIYKNFIRVSGRLRLSFIIR